MFQKSNDMFNPHHSYHIHMVPNMQYIEYLPTIEEVDEILEELDDSFELDEEMLVGKIKRKLFSQNRKKGVRSGKEHAKDIGKSTASLRPSSTFADSDDDEFDPQKLKDESTHIDLARVNTLQRMRTIRIFKKWYIIPHDAKWKKIWDNILAYLIVIFEY